MTAVTLGMVLLATVIALIYLWLAIELAIAEHRARRDFGEVARFDKRRRLLSRPPP